MVPVGCAPRPEPAPPRTVTPPATRAPSPHPLPATDAGAVPAETLEQRAARLHRQAIVVDGHNDIPSVLFGTGKDIDQVPSQTHTDLVRMKRGGIGAEFFSIYVESGLADKPTHAAGSPLRRAMDLVDVTYRQVERHAADLALATSTEEIRRAKRDGKIAILMGIEGGHAIENSLAALRGLHRLGCRYMTLTHTNTNDWADSAGSSGPPPIRHHGLTPFGEEVVREMQRIGMLVDVSHVADETFWSVIKVAKAPIIASHSSTRALADHRRNLSDDMLRALAKNDGIVMINFWSVFLSNDYRVASRRFFDKQAKAFADLRARYKDDPLTFRAELDKLKAQSEPFPKVPLSVLVDHIDHAVKVAGIDHVGLGSDFDGVDALPEGIASIADLPKITLELVRRGYSDEDVLKILGENFLRVFAAAERFAAASPPALSGDGSTMRWR